MMNGSTVDATENHPGDVLSDDERKNVVSSGGSRIVDTRNSTYNPGDFAQRDYPHPDPIPNENAVGLSNRPHERAQDSGMAVNVEENSSLYLKSDSLDSREATSPSNLTTQDINTIRTLDKEYDLSLIEREIGWNARYISVRQNAGLTLWIMCIFIVSGTIVFQFTTNWTVTDSILFCVYTITTVGYGNIRIPDHSPLHLFISLYILLGIAALTIVVAQTYQWIVLEATRLQYRNDKQEYKKRVEQVTKVAEDLELAINGEEPLVKMDPDSVVKKSCRSSTREKIAKLIPPIQSYLHNNPYGQLLAVLLPFFFMILLGALIVGVIEGWRFSESFYFATVSMTTVGFGDLVPDNPVSKWFCIFWLPFSVGFLSLYLSSIARFYLHLSGKTVERVEHRIRKRLYSHRAMQEKEREEAMERVASGGFGVEVDHGEINVGAELMQDPPSHIKHPARKNIFAGFATVPTRDQSEPEPNLASVATEDRNRRRNEVLCNSGFSEESFTSMKTMKDVIVAVKLNTMSGKRSHQKQLDKEDAEKLAPSTYPEKKDQYQSSPTRNKLSLQSTTHYSTTGGIEKKPTFALRVLVQERLAAIIAYEIAGYQSCVSIKNTTLSVSIDSLSYTSEKWMIPRRAIKAFRAVAFEALYYVGERDLILFGPDALFNLKPRELQTLFGPLLAALGDADTMEMWLYSTNNLVNTEFQNGDALTNKCDGDEIEGEPILNETTQEKIDCALESSEAQLGAKTDNPTNAESAIDDAITFV